MVGYIPADLVVSLSCTPCLTLSYLIHPRELRDVTIILPCNQYKIFGCPASWLFWREVYTLRLFIGRMECGMV
jgi:hypothetical protein